MLIDSTLLYHVSNSPPSEKYRFLSKVYSQDHYCLLCTECISPLKISRLHAYKMRNWLEWVNENIILQLADESLSENRLGVLMRIAVCMLDKVPGLDDVTRIEICSNLQRNVRIEYYNIRTEGLPF